MENATKALIMAGAILIAILIISVGIIIFKSTDGVGEQVDNVSESMAMSTFNSQFLEFIGNNVSKQQAKMLISRIIANNSKNTHKVNLKVGTITYGSDSSSLSNAISRTYSKLL